MKWDTVIRKIRKKGVTASVKYVMQNRDAFSKLDAHVFSILLLTNRDSDNLGDLVIEACDLSLIETVMQNLGIADHSYRIVSRAAGIISKKYVATRNPVLLESAEKAVQEADLVIFGGAPLFNYQYQIFYERTAVTLELAQKYGKPVMFSAIGIEGYDASSSKCQRLKKTLNFDCVRQITTRDDYDSLCRYIENENIRTEKVADPAVFAREVFAEHLHPEKKRSGAAKTVGIFVLRAGGFKSNGIDFSRQEAADLWIGLAQELEQRGYTYRFLTSGHFGDEAFLDFMVRECGVDAEKCIFNYDAPERLVRALSRFDAVVSCRLHPSIISWSLGVPSIGIIWSSKVAQFYEAVGYADRAVALSDASPQYLAQRIDGIIGTDVQHDDTYRMSVYRTLFDGIQEIMVTQGWLQQVTACYDYDQLLVHLVPFTGTSRKAKDTYLTRKLRRTYENYNKKSAKALSAQKIETFGLILHSGAKTEELTCVTGGAGGTLSQLSSGALELRIGASFENTGKSVIPALPFHYPGHVFVGWRMRVKNAGAWYWYMDDGSFRLKQEIGKQEVKKVLADEEALPLIPMHDLDIAVLEAVWRDMHE